MEPVKATPEAISSALASSEHGIIYITEDAEVTDLHHGTASMEIQLGEGSRYIVTAYSLGTILDYVQVGMATVGSLSAARGAFEPRSYGTPKAWDAVMKWAVVTLSCEDNRMLRELNERQQVWSIGGKQFVVSRVQEVGDLGYETMIFTFEGWYGYAPLIEVWADRPADKFTPFHEVVNDYVTSGLVDYQRMAHHER